MLEQAVSVAALVALLVALPAASQRRELRPLAALCLLAFAGNPLRSALTSHVLAVQEAMRADGIDPLIAPLTGVTRIEGHAIQILALSWGAAVSAVVAHLFGQRAWPALLTFAAASICMIVGYHQLRGTLARPVYLAADLAALALSVRAVVRWAWLRRSPESIHLAGIALLLFEGARLLAYHRGPWTTWDVARVSLVAEFITIIACCGGALCFLSRSRSSLSESR